MALRPWNLISVCAGVGGLDLGVQLAEPAARTVCYVEREAHAAAVLVARMEEGWLHPAPVWSDLRTFDAGAWRGAADCFVSGDPCQGNSVAGKRLGEADDRWLADRVVECFDASGAHRLFRENVTGNAIGQISYFVPALERLGCRVAVGIFSAKQLGFSHRRERLFIMADRVCDGQQWSAERYQRQAQSKQPASRGRYPERCYSAVRANVDNAEGKREQRELGDEARAQYAPSCNIGLDQPYKRCRRPNDNHAGGCREHDGIGLGNAVGGGDGRVTPDAWRQSIERASFDGASPLPLLCPGPNDPRWPDIIARSPQLEPAVRRMADGMADRVDRLRACGNGVVPLVAGYAWRTLEARLAAAESSTRSVLRSAA